MASASAMRGSASCSGRIVVCIASSDVGVHAAGIEYAGRIERKLQLARQALERGAQRLGKPGGSAPAGTGADRRGVPAVNRRDTADLGGACVRGCRHLEPDE